MIAGVEVRSLSRLSDERGEIRLMLRCDDAHFEQFGEIYFSTVYPQAIKAWHLHRVMTLNYAVIVGAVKLVIFDDRANSPTRGTILELFPSEGRHALITIPPNVWNGFKGIGSVPAVVANCATHPHDPNEISRLNPFSPDIPYDWSIRHG